MPAFYVLGVFIAGILTGFKIQVNTPSQVLIITLSFFILLKSVRAQGENTRFLLLIMVFLAGLIRPSFCAISVLPESLFANFQDMISPLRDSLVYGIGYGLSETHRELIGGIILGRGSGTIEIKNWTHFVNSGMSHLLVASGAQVSLTVYPIILLAEHLGFPARMRNLLFVTAGAMLLLLLLLVGQEPSILRAITACYFYLAARLINRKAYSLNIIYVTALIWLFANPDLVHNIGFRLSYVASWGLIYIYPRLKKLIPIPRIILSMTSKSRFIRIIFTSIYEIALLCASAQLAVIPVLAFHFHRISPSGFIANVIAIPVCELATYAGLASAVLFQIYEPASGFLNAGNSYLLLWLDSIAHYFAGVPYIFSGKIHWLGLILPYVFTGLYMEARFRPYSIISSMQNLYRITHPIEFLKDELLSGRE